MSKADPALQKRIDARKAQAQLTVQEQVRKSILDMRRIYPEKSNEDFAKWYEKKYRVKATAVQHVVEEAGFKDA